MFNLILFGGHYFQNISVQAWLADHWTWSEQQQLRLGFAPGALPFPSLSYSVFLSGLLFCRDDNRLHRAHRAAEAKVSSTQGRWQGWQVQSPSTMNNSIEAALWQWKSYCVFLWRGGGKRRGGGGGGRGGRGGKGVRMAWVEPKSLEKVVFS